ncbi:prephenate dehydrogenase [Clostridium sp. AM58-1XD]|uniref:prephenate dehydrogenase n=1 Tax=Clostridium sp. AM58-1XD TaxID=2292307 RepID=UPI000E50C254|nr:prephenate dehydrogenase [Clostridium sp. AM58-1XD]RGZ00689.1 prephenate dehydrogenase [Clostridium sp. AM58-1XD]
METTIGFIGLGLIGGSIARGLKRSHPDIRVMAYMRTRSKLEQAQKDGIVDDILDGVDERFGACSMIFLCTPVEYNAGYLSQLKPFLKPHTIVTDVGSTKTAIHEAVVSLSMEEWFIGGHPMAGSEKTGYENSTDHLLENAYYMITPSSRSTEDQISRLVAVAEALGSIPKVIDYHEHDFAVAAISHLPHIVASSLVNLVRDSDSSEEIMKQIAAGGFKDITRIASASPEMWEQICMTNTANIMDILEKYIHSLNIVLDQLKARNSEAVYRLFDSSRTYRNSISDVSRGAIEPEYAFSVDIVDEVGSISTLSVILAAKGISMKNIGINHSREHGEGALRIAFYDEASMEAAWEQLTRYKYELMKM